MNKFQAFVFDNKWNLNIILKARQLGLSTFIEIYILDTLLFKSNVTAGIIDATLPDAKKKLEKIKFAYENFAFDYPKLREEFLKIRRLIDDNVQELSFNNGSSVTADTTFRGSTLQILHVSEHAKTCKNDPIKAREIRTGALNAVGLNQQIFIESTAEDAEGDFYDLCQKAERLHLEKAVLTLLDFKFFFFPWWENEEYSLECPSDFVFSAESANYFNALEVEIGRTLTRNQKFWYVKKKETQDEDMKKEYPSTSKEAFEASSEDKYYTKEMTQVKKENRICEFPIAQGIPVQTYWDLGRGKDGYTSIGFAQIIGKEFRWVDFLEGNDEHISFYAHELTKKGYLYGKVYLPHDARHKLLAAEKSIEQQMKDFGFDVVITPSMPEEQGINEVRKLLPSMWFRKSTTEKLVEHLEKFSKKWNEVLGRYTGPKENEHIHACLDGNSLILTECGSKPIKDIRVGEKAWTPMGYCRIYGAGLVKTAKTMIKIETVDGSVLRCTPEHKIFTNRGLLRADGLRYNDVIWKQIDPPKLNFKELRIGLRNAIILRMQPRIGNSKGYIELFGNTIMEPFQRAITYITRMGIPSTITSIIWNAFQLLSIYPDMQIAVSGLDQKKTLNNSLKLQFPCRKNGIVVKRVGNGTAKCLKTPGKRKRRSKNRAYFVERGMKHIALHNPSSVTRIAKLSTEENVYEEVYDLSVEKHHCYLANGLLVSNCDMARYAAVNYTDKSKSFRRFRKPETRAIMNPLVGF